VKRSFVLFVALFAVISLPLFSDNLFTVAKLGTGDQVRVAALDAKDIDAKDANGMTAAMIAAQFNPNLEALVMLWQAGAEFNEKVVALAAKNPNPGAVMICQQIAKSPKMQKSQVEAVKQGQESFKLKTPAWLAGYWTTKADYGDSLLTVSEDRVIERTAGGEKNLIVDFLSGFKEIATTTTYTISGQTKTGTEKLVFTKVNASHITRSLTVDQGAPTTTPYFSVAALQAAREKMVLKVPEWLQGHWGAEGGGFMADSGDLRTPEETAIAAFIDDPLSTLTATAAATRYALSGTIRGRPATWTFTKIDARTVRFDMSEDGNQKSWTCARQVEMDYEK
jgi:hypothetical protein